MSKKKKSRRRVNQKLPPLLSSGVNVRPQNWHDHLPELLYILGALEDSKTDDVIPTLVELAKDIPGFTGRVTDVGYVIETLAPKGGCSPEAQD